MFIFYFDYQASVQDMKCKDFPPIHVGCVFNMVVTPFVLQKLFNLMLSHWPIFAFVSLVIGFKSVQMLQILTEGICNNFFLIFKFFANFKNNLG